jgi:DNA-binding GntR family transcriptional regulator
MRISSDQQSELPSTSISLAAYELLRGKLLCGALPGASVVQERRLAEELGFSRTPIPEVLQRLEGEGLLERQSRFLRVAGAAATEVMEILAIRWRAMRFAPPVAGCPQRCFRISATNLTRCLIPG